jgi:4,4'-diaponeurosporenoate glycosyltransferase
MLANMIVVVLALICGLFILWRIPQVTEQPGRPEDLPTISLIIPAYNEARRLQPLLDSIRRQDWQPFEWIVVDDFSTDATASLARSGGACVVRSIETGAGWIGKSRACWSGAQAAGGDWLLFLDADTRLAGPDSLRRLAEAYRRRGGRGLLSVQPDHRVARLYESLSTLFNVILMAGMSVFTPLGTRLRAAGAFGPCILCRRSDYIQVGGHAAIRASIMDDLALGRAFHDHALPVHALGGRGVLWFRMYPEGLASLCEGWSKNFGSAARSTHPLVLVLIILWICGGFSVVTWLVLALVAGAQAWLLAGIASYLAYAAQLIWLARRTGGFALPLLLAFPILHTFFALLFGWSLILTRVLRTVRWRGRKIRL